MVCLQKYSFLNTGLYMHYKFTIFVGGKDVQADKYHILSDHIAPWPLQLKF